MKLLVTRPLDDAKATAKKLQQAGHAALIAPIMVINPAEGVSEADLDLDTVSGLIITSANGLRAFMEISQRRDLTIYAVGDSSASMAEQAGFDKVFSAAGDTTSLARLIDERHANRDKPLLHIAGKTVAGDLPGLLQQAGVPMRRVILYTADLVDDLPIDIVAAFTHKQVDGVLLYSPRTATHFSDLVKNSMLTGEMPFVTVYCLSQAVADAVADLDWKKVLVAARPDEDALFALFGEDNAIMTDKDAADKKAETETSATEKAPVDTDSKPDDKAKTPSKDIAEQAPTPTKVDAPEKSETADKPAKPAKSGPVPKTDAKPAAKPAAQEKPAAQKAAAAKPAKAAPVVKKGPGLVTVSLVALVMGGAVTLALPKVAPIVVESLPVAATILPEEAVTPNDFAALRAQLQQQVTASVAAMQAALGEQQQALVAARQQNETLATQQADILARLDVMPGLVSDLSTRLAAMENRQDPNYQEAIRIVQDMEARMRQVEASAARAEAISTTRIADQVQPYVADMRQLARDVAGLEDVVGTIATDARYGDRKAAIALAIGQLRGAVERGGRMDAELFALRDLLTGLPTKDSATFDDAIAILAAMSDQALASPNALVESFDQVETRFGQEVAGDEDQSWVSVMAAQFDALVKVRRVSADGSNDDEDLRFVEAYEAAKRGDLDTALAKVTVEDRDYTTWRQAVIQRRNALKAVDMLEAAATALLARQQQTGAE